MVNASSSTINFACQIRRHALRMVHRVNASHIGGCLSAADLLAHLYTGFLRVDPKQPEWSGRDRFIMSKGHSAAIIYACLAEAGFFSIEELKDYWVDGGRLAGHVTHHNVPGAEVSTGALGHGLPMALGMALSFQRDGLNNRAIVMMSDGECDEGSIWEAALLAPQLKLDNLLVIIDYNKIQSLGRTEDVIDLNPFADKWKSFRWAVKEIDGHDHKQIADCLATFPFEEGKPSVIIANTVKGKGVSFMEDLLAWHYKCPNDEQLEQALKEIDAVEQGS